MERILFIDFGYSKTSYIISSYSKNEFQVEKEFRLTNFRTYNQRI